MSSVPGTGSTFISNGGLLNQPIGMTIGHTGNLFVSNLRSPFIQEFDINSGAFLGTLLDVRTIGVSLQDARTFSVDFAYDPTWNRYLPDHRYQRALRARLCRHVAEYLCHSRHGWRVRHRAVHRGPCAGARARHLGAVDLRWCGSLVPSQASSRVQPRPPSNEGQCVVPSTHDGEDAARGNTLAGVSPSNHQLETWRTRLLLVPIAHAGQNRGHRVACAERKAASTSRFRLVRNSRSAVIRSWTEGRVVPKLGRGESPCLRRPRTRVPGRTGAK